MRIAEIAPPYLTVPPSDYGGIELVVALLADGLVDRGHDVTLFASGGSGTNATVVPSFGVPPGPDSLGDQEYCLLHDLTAYLRAGEFDLIHDHTLHGPAFAALLRGRPPVVHTLHGPWTEAGRAYYGRLQHAVDLVAISESQRAGNPDVAYAGVVPNGIHLSAYPLREDKEDVLAFMGRATHEKGPEVAVEVAKCAGLPLVMVVKRAEAFEQRYWDEVVAPRLTGDEEIHDAMGHDDKVALMGRARALLMPIQWAEPFGLVMIEAMACGTPVVACPLGAAPEIVRDGETGFLRESVEEMAGALPDTAALSPRACRKHVERCFSADAMVERYERLFERIMARLPAA